MTPDDLARYIRDVPDFPSPGIIFKDLTPVLRSPEAFRRTVELLDERLQGYRPEALAAIESRGFLFGAAMAMHRGLPLTMLRKPGKLPGEVVGVDYALEYGSDRIEAHRLDITRGRRYVLVDDLIATGGTAAAGVKLLNDEGAEVVCCAFVMELGALVGRARLEPHPVESLIVYT